MLTIVRFPPAIRCHAHQGRERFTPPQRMLGDDGVFTDLEVEHPNACEIRAVFKGVLEPLARVNRTGGQDFVELVSKLSQGDQ